MHQREIVRPAKRRPIAPVLCALALALCIGGAPDPATAGADPPGVKAAKTKLRGEVHELAAWCASRKLFGTRHDLYELVLELWPEDEVARKWNGYPRDPAGGWLPSSKKRPRNLAAGALPVLREMQSRIANDYVRAIASALRQEPGDAAGALRGQAIRHAVAIAPDDAEIRKRNGEVPGKVKGRKGNWILLETARSRTRRPALREAAKRALASVPKPEKDAPRAMDLHSSVQWAHAYKGPRARILGISNCTEVDQGLVHGQACFPFFESAFGFAPPDLPGLVFYVFDTTSRGNVYLAGQGGMSQSYLKFVAPLAAMWIPNADRVVIKAPQREVRLEGPARQVLGAFMGRMFGITGRQGWATEGFGLHLTHHITGTRLLYSVRQSQYGEKEDVPDLSKRLREVKTDWMAEARALLAGRYAPDLRLVLGKTVNTMTPEDLLMGYVLAVFLLEGRHDVLTGLLRGIAGVKEANYDAVFGQHMGMDVASLEHRVRRWMDETKDLK